ncbi:MAG: Gfo/Idh/MocA family oxidoreductase [Lachnospiraceae bacterium]
MKKTMAIIGFGGMGGWHYNNITTRIPELTVKGVLDIRQERLEKARELNLHIYESLDEILADEELDFVSIIAPNDTHKEYAIACLRGGKHVVCEKPVTMNAAELEEIMVVAKETGKLFTIHHNRRLDKDYKIIKKIIEEDIIGQPYFIENRVQGSRQSLHGWRGHKPNGGGMVFDWGVHLLDQMLMLIDSKVVSVDAHLQYLFSNEVDDNIKIFLRFENKVSAVLEMSTNCLINTDRWHLSCIGGTAVIHDWECNGKIVQLRQDADMQWEDDIVYTEAGPTRTMAPRPSYTTIEKPLPEVETDWTDFYKNVMAAIDGVESPDVLPHEALRVMKVIDLIFESDVVGHGIACYI